MSRLEIVLSAIFLVSLVLNIGIFIYARAVVARLLFIADEIGDVQKMIDAFIDHLQGVYSLESFYGDDTLRHLLEHAISLSDELRTFEEVYSLIENKETIFYDNDDPQEARSSEEPPAKEKPLLYQDT